jgi:hypothetical protein
VNVAESYRVSLHDLVLLQVNIKERKDVFGLNQEGNFPAVFKILVGADVNFLDFKWQVGGVGFGDVGFLGLGFAIDFIFVTEKSVTAADDEAVVKDGDNDEIVFLVFEVFLWEDVGDELAKETRFWGADGREADFDLFGEDETLLLEVCVNSIRHYLIKIIQKFSPFFILSILNSGRLNSFLKMFLSLHTIVLGAIEIAFNPFISLYTHSYLCKYAKMVIE